MCSVFAKLFDLILLTSDLQFGFKKKHSTSMCTMALKETLAYYSGDGGTAFCTSLDATKALDRVDYCKLFRELIKRDVPAIHLLYVDGLLQRLRDSKIGCWIGSVYVGVLAYADDVTLLVPTPRAMRLQLQICEDYAREYRIVFNATVRVSLGVYR